MARSSNMAVVMVLLVAVLLLAMQPHSCKAQEEELIESVVELVAAEESTESENNLKAATYLTVTFSGGKLTGTTNGGKTFSGTGAKGTGTGVGLLNKGNGIYDRTTSFEVFAGTGVQNIVFRDANGRNTGTWSGTIVPPVPASKGTGKFTR